MLTITDARRLKKAGFPQNTQWYYVSCDGLPWELMPHREDNSIAVPTFEELQKELKGELSVTRVGGQWEAILVTETRTICSPPYKTAEKALTALWLQVRT